MGLQDDYFEKAGVKPRDASLSPTLTLTPHPREKKRTRVETTPRRREVPDDEQSEEEKDEPPPEVTGRLPSVSFSPSEWKFRSIAEQGHESSLAHLV